MNIMDNMDAARFKSKNTRNPSEHQKKSKQEDKMPTVLKNLKNGS
ncbi:hypothetical protein [Bacillus alkalicellulosilyticus]|nr:hypothetical protein [Bacillus alkalicellulosilyticus]